MTVDSRVIRDANLRIIGYIDTDEFGFKTAKSGCLEILGQYNPRLDKTFTFGFGYVGEGDLTEMLIGLQTEN